MHRAITGSPRVRMEARQNGGGDREREGSREGPSPFKSWMRQSAGDVKATLRASLRSGLDIPRALPPNPYTRAKAETEDSSPAKAGDEIA
jgi:hypothetical protein